LRADFYHRLSAYPLQVPPLRERGRDVLLLAGSFLEENRSRLGLGGLRLEATAQAALLGYDWPGNVRELEHLLGRSVLKALGRQPRRPRILSLVAEDLDLPQVRQQAAVVEAHGAGSPISPEPPEASATGRMSEAVDEFKRKLIASALVRHDHNLAAAARSLGMDRGNLARLARRLDLPTDKGR
jgi:anaerobic nitric oxide reductase transcription regulator